MEPEAGGFPPTGISAPNNSYFLRMDSHFRPATVFVGKPDRLEAAYPPALRSEISEDVEILGSDIPGDHWEAHAAELGRAVMIMSTWGMPVLTPEFLAAAPNLKAVFYAAGSVKHFATDEAYEKGVLIFSARMANAVRVAEYAAAAVVLSLKQFWAYSRTVRESRSWRRTIPVAGTYHSTIGLVSLGATGRQTAERLSHLDCKLIAFDPFVQQETARDLGASMVSLDEVFRLSDVVSVHAPLLPETRGLIGGQLLDLMKSGATLINTSRGAVIVESELCDFLERRPDITAVLDVVDLEPPDQRSPLFTLPNVVLTPHIAGSMGNEIVAMGRLMAAELKQYLSSRPLSHMVSRELLSQSA
jgi:phosphoglycerate dehydrogenase-like enzyme